jgi:hypothetical protein
MLCQFNLDCTKDATWFAGKTPVCDEHYVVKKVQEHQSKQILDQSRITIEFCTWLQKTEVFDLFTDHLNNGISLQYVDVNTKAKAKGV